MACRGAAPKCYLPSFLSMSYMPPSMCLSHWYLAVLCCRNIRTLGAWCLRECCGFLPCATGLPYAPSASPSRPLYVNMVLLMGTWFSLHATPTDQLGPCCSAIWPSPGVEIGTLLTAEGHVYVYVSAPVMSPPNQAKPSPAAPRQAMPLGKARCTEGKARCARGKPGSHKEGKEAKKKKKHSHKSCNHVLM